MRPEITLILNTGFCIFNYRLFNDGSGTIFAVLAVLSGIGCLLSVYELVAEGWI